MPGIRIVHDTLRNANVVVEHPTLRYKEPYLCPKCQRVHTFKSIHLELDPEGITFVSEQVFALLRQSGMPGFTALNTVSDPPDQTIVVGETPLVNFRIEYEGNHPHLFSAKNRMFAPRKPKG